MITSRWVRWALHLAHMEENNDAYRDLMGSLEEKRPLGRLKLRGKVIIF
jgi:hypothetical protein